MISTLLLLMLMGQKEAAKHPVAALSGHVTDRYSMVYAQKCGEGKPEWVAVYADAQMKILLPNPLTADSSGDWTSFTNVPTKVLIGKPGTGKGVIVVECFDPAHVPPTAVVTNPSFTTEERISDLEKRVKELDSRQAMQDGGHLPLCDNCFDSPDYDPSKPTIARKPSYDTTELCGENRHLERWSLGDVGIAAYPISLPPGYQPSSTLAPQGDSHPDKCVPDKMLNCWAKGGEDDPSDEVCHPMPKHDSESIYRRGISPLPPDIAAKLAKGEYGDPGINQLAPIAPKSYSCTSPSGARLICGEGCKDCKEVVIPFPDGSALYKTVPDKSK